jgi:hypothetical protein
VSWDELGPPTRASSTTPYIPHQRDEFVDEAASERFESTASMPSMMPQRCAPAPTAMQTLCRVHASLSRVPWRRAVRCRPFAHHASGRQLVFASGALSPGASHWEAPGARLGGVLGRCAGAQGSNSRPVCPIPRVAAAHGYPSACSQAPLRASRSPLVAAARRPACLASPRTPRTPPPPSPWAVSAARGHSREACGTRCCCYCVRACA